MHYEKFGTFGYGGIKDLVVDATSYLETGERLDLNTTVTSLDTSDITISGIAILSTDTVVEGRTYPADTSVRFRVTSIGTTTGNFRVKVTISGNSGTEENFLYYIPVREYGDAC